MDAFCFSVNGIFDLQQNLALSTSDTGILKFVTDIHNACVRRQAAENRNP